MGWRPSTIRDVMVVTLVRHGPLTTRQLGETISDRYIDWWIRAHGRWPESHQGRLRNGKWGTIKRPLPVTYTDLYQRLQSIQGTVIVRSGRGGPYNAYLWRAVTKRELGEREEDRRKALREQLAVPAELRERAVMYAKEIGCEVEFRVEPETPFDEVSRGWLVLATGRGRVKVDGPPDQSWYDAAIEVGLL